MEETALIAHSFSSNVIRGYGRGRRVWVESSKFYLQSRESLELIDSMIPAAEDQSA